MHHREYFMTKQSIAYATIRFPDKNDTDSNIKVHLKYDNVTDGLRHIAREINFPFQDRWETHAQNKWNQQTFGKKLIETFGLKNFIDKRFSQDILDSWGFGELEAFGVKAEKNVAYIRQFTIKKLDNNSIEISRDFEINKNFLNALIDEVGAHFWQGSFFKDKDNIAHAKIHFPQEDDKQGSIKVYVSCQNVSASLSYIARAINFPVNDEWNQRQLAIQLIKAHGNDNIAHINQFTIKRLDNNSIKTSFSFEISKQFIGKFIYEKTGLGGWEDSFCCGYITEDEEDFTTSQLTTRELLSRYFYRQQWRDDAWDWWVSLSDSTKFVLLEQFGETEWSADRSELQLDFFGHKITLTFDDGPWIDNSELDLYNKDKMMVYLEEYILSLEEVYWNGLVDYCWHELTHLEQLETLSLYHPCSLGGYDEEETDFSSLLALVHLPHLKTLNLKREDFFINGFNTEILSKFVRLEKLIVHEPYVEEEKQYANRQKLKERLPNCKITEEEELDD